MKFVDFFQRKKLKRSKDLHFDFQWKVCIDFVRALHKAWTKAATGMSREDMSMSLHFACYDTAVVWCVLMLFMHACDCLVGVNLFRSLHEKC